MVECHAPDHKTDPLLICLRLMCLLLAVAATAISATTATATRRKICLYTAKGCHRCCENEQAYHNRAKIFNNPHHKYSVPFSLVNYLAESTCPFLPDLCLCLCQFHFLIRSMFFWAEQHIKQKKQSDHCRCSAQAKATTSQNGTKLINHQRYQIGQTALIANRK